MPTLIISQVVLNIAQFRPTLFCFAYNLELINMEQESAQRIYTSIKFEFRDENRNSAKLPYKLGLRVQIFCQIEKYKAENFSIDVHKVN